MTNHQRLRARLYTFAWGMGLLLLHPPAAAQVIRGTVLDDLSLSPIAAGRVRLVHGDELGASTETDEGGRFLLSLPDAGMYRLEFSRLGYQTTTSQALTVEPGDTLSVEFRVRPDAVLMAPITVVGQSRRGRDRFEHRQMEWDRGFFLTPAMVDSIAPEYPAELLKGLDKVDVRWGWGRYSNGSSGPLPSIRTVMGRGCMLYMVDFVPVQAEPWASSDWAGYQLSSLRGEDIVAVEVYRSALEVPPDLRRFTDQLRPFWGPSGGMGYQESIQCGLTVFWTRAGW